MADTRAMLAEARELYERGRVDEAAGLVRRIAAACPRDPTVLGFGAYLAWKRGSAEEAIAGYRRLLELEPANPAHAANLALVCFKARRFEEALAAWARQLELQPGDARALRGAGSCHERLGDLERALDCFLRAGDEESAARVRGALPPAGAPRARPASPAPGGTPPAGGPGGGDRPLPRLDAWAAGAVGARPGEGLELAPGEDVAVVAVRGKVHANPAYLAGHRGVLVFAPAAREAAKAAGRFGDPRVALLRAEGSGELVVAAGGRRLLPVRVGGDPVFVNAPALAFCGEGVEVRFEPAGMAKGVFQAVELGGEGPVLLAFRGGPLVLPVLANQPTLVRPHAAVAWTGSLTWEAETVADLRKHAGKGEALRYRFEGRGHLILQAV